LFVDLYIGQFNSCTVCSAFVSQIITEATNLLTYVLILYSALVLTNTRNCRHQEISLNHSDDSTGLWC